MKKPNENESPLREFVFPERLARFQSVAASRSRTLTFVFDELQHPHNISAVIRSADAFGLAELHFIGSHFAQNKGVTIGADKWVKIIRHRTPGEAVAQLREANYRIVILEPPSSTREIATPQLSVLELPFEERLALVFGNEVRGLSDTFRLAASYSAYIPMLGFVESLNVSVATAICMFCSTFARTTLNRRIETLSSEEQRVLVEEWLRADVPGAEEILRRYQP